jgi:Zn-dependent protease with chaperone function
MASYILQGSDMLGIAGSLLAPLKYALLYWQRKSELSADRAAALVEGIDEVVDTQVRLAGGSKTLTKGINIKEWVSQADRYEAIRTGSIWDKTLQTLAVMENTHPFAAVRVKEILKWGETEQYGQLRDMLKSEWTKQACPSCKQPVKAEWAFCRRCGAKI